MCRVFVLLCCTVSLSPTVLTVVHCPHCHPLSPHGHPLSPHGHPLSPTGTHCHTVTDCHCCPRPHTVTWRRPLLHGNSGVDFESSNIAVKKMPLQHTLPTVTHCHICQPLSHGHTLSLSHTVSYYPLSSQSLTVTHCHTLSPIVTHCHTAACCHLLSLPVLSLTTHCSHSRSLATLSSTGHTVTHCHPLSPSVTRWLPLIVATPNPPL
jgi:hypothetical protein